MFLKPYRVKAHTQLKTSDKKRLRLQVSQQFPALPEEEVHTLVPLKDDVSTIKIFCHKGEPSLAYMSGSECFAFSVESRVGGTVLLPSLYLCWKFPHLALAPTFVTHADVLARLQKGADLMMPGVIYSGQLTQTTFGQFDASTPAVVVSRGAIIAVGTTALSSTDLYMAGGHGKAVIVQHVVGDHLWATYNKVMPQYTEGESQSRSPEASVKPAAAAPTETPSPAAAQPSCSQAPISYSSVASGKSSVASGKSSAASGKSLEASGKISAASVSSVPVSRDPGSGSSGSPTDGSGDAPSMADSVGADMEQLNLQQQPVAVATDDLAATPPQVLSISEAMDGLLLHCFLKAVQQSKASLPLPLLVSTFYRVHVLPACPDNQTLDIKKTNYKKLSKFLKAMEERGILQVTEHPKGIENITSVAYDHEDVVSFRYYKAETTKKSADGAPEFVPPTMEEVYQVSGDTVQFFRACGKSKGDVLTRMEVREIVTSYIKRKKLVDTATKMVSLEPPLHNAVVSPKEGLVRSLKWDQVFSRLLGRMAPAVRIQRTGFPDIVKKGRIDPIEMVVAKRAGNKKVTLLYNVGQFGITETEFAREIQHMAAASTSVGPAEHKPQGTVQILVQGNATADVAKLLLATKVQKLKVTAIVVKVA